MEPTPSRTAAPRSSNSNATMSNSFGPSGMMSIWSTDRRNTGPANNDELVSNGSSPETGFPPRSGSSSLAANTQAEAWGRPSQWNSTESSQARNTSSSTSPNRTRDTANRHLPSPSQYYTAAAQVQQPAIGQRGTANSTGRRNPSLAFETSPNSLSLRVQPGQYPDNTEQQSGVSFAHLSRFEADDSASSFRGEARSGQVAYAGLPPPAFPPYGPEASRTAHVSQRGSFSVMPGSDSLDNIIQPFNQGLSFNDSGTTQSGAGNFSSFRSNGNGNFRLNPGSQVWVADIEQRNGDNEHAYSGHNLSGVYQSNRPAAAERGSTTNGAYRQGRDSPEQWSRPTSRGSRTAAPNHRGSNHHAIPQQFGQPYPQLYHDATFLGGQVAPYGGHYNYGPNMRLPQVMQYQQHHLAANYMTGRQIYSARPNRDHDPADIHRSPILRDFRTSQKTNKRYELKDIYGNIVEFCGDQHGSRFIQEKLTTANSDEKDVVFAEISTNTVQLMEDVFGNYVVQKLFEHGTQLQKKLLAQAMKGKVYDLSLNQYGCRVLQEALKRVLHEQQRQIIKELEVPILKVIHDEHGNHVVQVVLELGDRQAIDFVFKCIRGKVKELSSNRYGCRVVQKAIEFGTPADKASIIEEVHASARDLINNEFGNYVIQHVLESAERYGRPEDVTRIINTIRGKVVAYSKEKYASNVIEKCDKHGTPEQVLQIEAELVAREPNGEESQLRGMIVHQYANYVIRKHADRTPNRQAYLETLRPHWEWAKNNDPKRHLEAIEKLLESSPARRRQATPPTRHSSVAPASPLQLDVGSAQPTPSLTMEPNSPSSSPPSTTESTVDEPVGVTTKARLASADGVSRTTEVQVADEG